MIIAIKCKVIQCFAGLIRCAINEKSFCDSQHQNKAEHTACGKKRNERTEEQNVHGVFLE